MQNQSKLRRSGGLRQRGLLRYRPPKRQLNLRPGAVVAFECVPADKTDEAIERALQVPGVKAATNGDDSGIVLILIDPEARFRKYSDCFDGPDWKLIKRVKSSGEIFEIGRATAALQEINLLPQKHGSDELTKQAKSSGAMGTNSPSIGTNFSSIGKLCLSPQKSTAGTLWNELLIRIGLTGGERATLPFIEALLGAHGRNFITRGNRSKKNKKDLFVCLSYDQLLDLEYYERSNPNARRTMEAMPTKPGKMFLMSYADAFGKTTLEDGVAGIILNPLKIRPSGDVVMMVEFDHFPEALANCTSQLAKDFRSVMCRMANEVIKISAENMVAELGPQGFVETIAEPAEVALMDVYTARKTLLQTQNQLGNMTVQAMRNDLRAKEEGIRADQERLRGDHLELDGMEKDVEIDTLGRQKQLAIMSAEDAEKTLEDHKAVNKPVSDGHTHERSGCVALKETVPSAKEKLAYLRKHGREVDTDRTRFVTYKYTSGGQSKKLTVAQSYGAISTRSGHEKYEEGSVVLALLGGIGVHQGKRFFKKAFDCFCATDSPRFNQLFYCDRGDKEAAAVKLLTDEFKRSFAVGIYDGRRIFINEKIMDALGEENRDACDKVARRLARA
jgi:hypothetical protein